jgi:hypothetical protein
MFDCIYPWSLVVYGASRYFQQYFSYIVAVSFIGGGNRGKTTELSQVTDKLYHIMLYTSPWSKLELTTSVVKGTDYIGSCKSNYHIDGEEISGNIKEFTLREWTNISCDHFIITSRRNPTEINESFNISDAICIFLESFSDAEPKAYWLFNRR